jgi:SAM-dependent methyltransferase
MTQSPPSGDGEPEPSGPRIVALQDAAAANAAALRRQYEAFPYPPRDAAAEAGGLFTGSPSHILEIDHYLFGGARDWTRPFRALVAGGGTGDAAIMLGQQCADIGCPAQIVYLDLSAASMGIARDRARQRGLTNIEFHQGSLLDLPARGWAPFEYIDCCGVLHHLASPEDGLRALAAVLAPEGGLGIMLYGKYGRTGIYDIQAAMRHLAAPGEDQAAQLPVLRDLIGQLPATNRLVCNTTINRSLDLPDSELVDKYLHPRDRAYTVPSISALCAAAGIRVESFVPRGRYDPVTYLASDGLRARLAALAPMDRATLAELVSGNIAKHVFYAVPASRPLPAPGIRPDAIPVLRKGDGAALADRFTPETAFQAGYDQLTVVAATPPLAADIMRRIDNATSLEDIYFDMAAGLPGLGWTGFMAQFGELYGALHGLLNAMFLRHRKDGAPLATKKG